METITNSFGEKQTEWTSHKHPNNPNFMQVVKYLHIQYADGRNNLYWRLYNSSANDKHMIPNITLSEAQALYVDAEVKELTDADFEQWLKESNELASGGNVKETEKNFVKTLKYGQQFEYRLPMADTQISHNTQSKIRVVVFPSVNDKKQIIANISIAEIKGELKTDDESTGTPLFENLIMPVDFAYSNIIYLTTFGETRANVSEYAAITNTVKQAYEICQQFDYQEAVLFAYDIENRLLSTMTIFPYTDEIRNSFTSDWDDGIVYSDDFAGGGNIYDRGSRPSPKESATLYAEGYEMQGQDGNMYHIVLDKNGKHSWKPCKDCDQPKDETKQDDFEIDTNYVRLTSAYAQYLYPQINSMPYSENTERLYKNKFKKILYDNELNTPEKVIEYLYNTAYATDKQGEQNLLAELGKSELQEYFKLKKTENKHTQNMETNTTNAEMQNEIEAMKSIMEDLPEAEKREIQGAINKLQAQIDGGEKPEDEVVETIADIEPVEDEQTIETNEISLSNNDFYLAHPEKVLGDIKTETNRFGKPIEIVTGNITNLQKMGLDFSFIDNNTSGDSIINTSKPEATAALIDDIIDKSERNIAKKAVVKKKRTTDSDISLTSDMMSFEETYDKYNDNITLEELRVFIWYKEQIGQPLNEKWYGLAEYDIEHPAHGGKGDEATWINEKVIEGLLYYFDGKLMPAYLYLAENIYEKYIRLVKSENVEHAGADAAYIIKTYGQQVYDNQVTALNNVYKTLYEQRLTIGEEGMENTLKLVPYSDFCKNFMIQSLIDEMPFKTATVTASKNKDFGKPDFFKDVREYQQKEMKEMSLTDAFSYWLAKERSNIVFKKGVSFADIIKIYINQQSRPKTPEGYDEKMWKTEWERKKEKTRSEGERIFNIFLVEQIKADDKVRIELIWNKSYNNYVPINYNKIPVALNVTRNFAIKPEKRDAISFLFNQGSGCLAYDVGVGKTPAAIFIIRQYIDSGYCERPMIIVPNQTYRQWLAEIRKIMPDIKINDLYNLGQNYQEELWNENNEVQAVAEKSITVLTYEGLEKLGFNEHTESEIFSQLYDILNQGGIEEKMSEKQKASFYQKLQKLIGRGLKDALVNIEDIGTDFICFDEAHAMKKIFTSVKGNVNEEDSKSKREKTPYKINSGMPSGTGLKGFMMAQYVLRNNHYRNILLLTATPFTNSPLEIFSMLSLVAYKQLQETDLNSISNFFDNYIEMQSELVVTATMKAEYKQVVTGFRNIASLQKLIFRFFDYKDENNILELKKIRPQKWVLPYLNKIVDGNVIKLGENEKIETYIPLSDLQESLMKDIIAYSEGNLSEKALGNANNFAEDFEVDIAEDELQDSEAFEVSESSMDEKEKAGVRIIKSIMMSQNLALSPYLYKHSGLGKPKFLDYINTSPKLKYVMECIKTVKKYHENKGEAVSGQIIYMNRGIEYFHLLKQYLVEIVGYQPHEVGLMYSQMKGGKEAKDSLKNLFLGIRYNEQLKSFEKISDEERVKIIIGSGTIKEGMNLQMKTTILYNCFLDWNPTDLLQLHGRLHRQGNEFKNVRIVNPLMVNSVDIFLFQKLAEKTTRINQIWKTGHKSSVLKLEELNPAELKFALIKDPKIIATYQIQDENAKMEDELASEQSLVKKYENIIKYQKELERYRSNVTDFLKEYRPKKYNDNLTDDQRIKMAAEIVRTQLDENGLKMVDYYSRADYEKKGIKISEHRPVSKQYWQDTVNIANRTIQREQKEYFAPRGMDIADCDKYILEHEFIIENVKENIKNLNSEENIAILVEEIKERKERDKIIEKDIPQLVSEFERLNYLLSIKFPPTDIAAILDEEHNCLMLTPNNEEIRIDTAAIDHLEACLETVPSTKSTYAPDGEYTEERKALHQQIYEMYQSKKICTDNDTPIAILTGGSPASGKTTFLRQYAPYLTSDKLYKIDADEIREQLPENKGWNSQSLHEETRDIVRDYILSDENIGKPCKFDIIYDGTMNSTKNYLPLIGRLKKLGYKVFIVYINNITYDIAVARSLERFKSGTAHRYVPRSVIADFFSKGKDALNELKTHVDGYLVVDGSNRDYNIIEQGGETLPKDRNYGDILTGGTKGVEALREKHENKKAEATQKIAAMHKAEQLKAQQEAEKQTATINAKREFLTKKIKAFETLLRLADKKDKAGKAFLEKKVRAFKLLAKMEEEEKACGGSLYCGGGTMDAGGGIGDKKIWEVMIMMNPIVPSEIENPKTIKREIVLDNDSTKTDVEKYIEAEGKNVKEILSITEKHTDSCTIGKVGSFENLTEAEQQEYEDLMAAYKYKDIKKVNGKSFYENFTKNINRLQDLQHKMGIDTYYGETMAGGGELKETKEGDKIVLKRGNKVYAEIVYNANPDYKYVIYFNPKAKNGMALSGYETAEAAVNRAKKMDSEWQQAIGETFAGGGWIKNIDKVKASIGEEKYNLIEGLDKERLEKHLKDIQREAEHEYLQADLSPRYMKLKDEEWLILKRLERSEEFDYPLPFKHGGIMELETSGTIGINWQSEFSNKETIQNDIMEHIAEMVAEGYTAGELSGEEPNYSGWWTVKIEKDAGDNEDDAELRMKEVADLIRDGNTSGHFPTFTMSANVRETSETMETGGLINTYFDVEFQQSFDTTKKRIYTDTERNAKNSIRFGYGIPINEIKIIGSGTSEGYFPKGIYENTERLDDGGIISEDEKKAEKWWSSLSINEQKEFAKKYDNGYYYNYINDYSLAKHVSKSLYYKIRLKIWENENKPNLAKGGGIDGTNKPNNPPKGYVLSIEKEKGGDNFVLMYYAVYGVGGQEITDGHKQEMIDLAEYLAKPYDSIMVLGEVIKKGNQALGVGGGIGINWHKFTLSDLDAEIRNAGGDIEYKIEEGDNRESADDNRRIWHSDVEKSNFIKNSMFSIGDIGKEIKLYKGEENINADITVYDQNHNTFTISLFSKENHAGLKKLTNQIIEKFAAGGGLSKNSLYDIEVPAENGEWKIVNGAPLTDCEAKALKCKYPNGRVLYHQLQMDLAFAEGGGVTFTPSNLIETNDYIDGVQYWLEQHEKQLAAKPDDKYLKEMVRRGRENLKTLNEYKEIFEKTEHKTGGLVRDKKIYNKDVAEYKWFVVDMVNKKAISGFESKNDANDVLSDFADGSHKVISERSLKILGIENPKEKWYNRRPDGTKYDNGGRLPSKLTIQEQREYDDLLYKRETNTHHTERETQRLYELQQKQGMQPTYNDGGGIEKQATGLIVVPSTEEDSFKIATMISKTYFYAEPHETENYWFFPEEESMYDALETQLSAEFDKRNISARFEGVFQYNEGGSIKNQYDEMTADDIWHDWTFEQRRHFMHDHETELRILADQQAEEFISVDMLQQQKEKKLENLPNYLHIAITKHVITGEFEGGGSITSRRFTENDFNKLTQDKFEGSRGVSSVGNSEYWEIIHSESNKIVGKFYPEKEKLSFVGSKKTDNPLVKWLQQNSFVSNDEYFKLKSGGGIEKPKTKSTKKPIKKTETEKPATKTQSILFEKAVWSKRKAKTWAAKHGYKNRIAEIGNSYQMKQIHKDRFKAGTFKTIELEKGIKASIAEPKRK